MNRRELFVFVLAVFVLSGLSHAADKPDPTGTWKWSYTDEDEQKVNVSLKLKYEDEKLTGTITIPGNVVGYKPKDIKITNAPFKDGKVKFDVRHTARKKEQGITYYLGMLDGDMITGVFETTPLGFDWEAKRENKKQDVPPKI